MRTTATIVSMTAALVSIATFARAWGLYGGPASFLTVGTIGARWVGVKPAQDTARAIGDTIYLAATVTGKNGSTLLGPNIGWSSDEPRIATVSDDGVVVARAAGTTTIVATVGSLAARSRITVQPVVAFVRIAGDSAVVVPEGGRGRASVRATDARGHVIPQKRAAWVTADSAVAYVDSTGHVVGLVPGRTTITATIDGVTALAPVTVAAVPGSLVLLGGGDQRAREGATLPHPVAVRVLDRRQQPIAGVPVRFRDPTGGGTLEPSIVFTDLDGHARSTWTLAPRPGRQRVQASVDHVDSSLVFVAEAEPSIDNIRILVSGAGQPLTAGSSLAEPLVATLTDSTGLPLVDVPVSWETSNGGTVTPLAPRTDSLGQARAKWTLGKRAGQQEVSLRAGSVGTVPVHPVGVTALPGAPAALGIVRGDAQRARVGASPARPIVLRVADSLGNAVADVKVTLAASAGALAEKELRTDSAGTVTVDWTLGRAAGVQRITARADGVEKPVEVKATATPAPPANVVFADLPADAPAGRRLSDTVWVTVTDGFGNAVPNVPVVFAIRTGALTTARAMTDARGRAATRWTLGAAAGAQTLTATVRGTDVKSARAVRARAAAAKPAAAKAPPAKSAARPAAARPPEGSGTTAPSSPGEPR
ncbi:MAG TPA: Ig-like domain-containing protein [Gemmatimonadaceae bacterium]|nr:Ig-like domain-containing protein [Gemmatimonadaceae bacterium]